MRLPQSEAEAKDKEDIAQDIEQSVELPDAFAFHELGARDLAVATVEDAENLEQDETPDKRPVSSVAENERGDDGNRKGRQGPRVWRRRKSQEKPAHHARDRSVQIA